MLAERKHVSDFEQFLKEIDFRAYLSYVSLKEDHVSNPNSFTIERKYGLVRNTISIQFDTQMLEFPLP